MKASKKIQILDLAGIEIFIRYQAKECSLIDKVCKMLRLLLAYFREEKEDEKDVDAATASGSQTPGEKKKKKKKRKKKSDGVTDGSQSPSIGGGNTINKKQSDNKAQKGDKVVTKNTGKKVQYSGDFATVEEVKVKMGEKNEKKKNKKTKTKDVDGEPKKELNSDKIERTLMSDADERLKNDNSSGKKRKGEDLEEGGKKKKKKKMSDKAEVTKVTEVTKHVTSGSGVSNSQTRENGQKKKRKNKKKNQKLQLSDERLKAYGINPKKYKYMKKEELFQFKGKT